MKKGCFTPSATACGGASSLKEGANGRAFFHKGVASDGKSEYNIAKLLI